MTQNQADWAFSAALLCICPFLYLEMRDIPLEGQVFPLALISLLGSCSLILGIRGFLRRSEPMLFDFFGYLSPKKWIVLIGAFFGYMIFAMNVSFLCATFIFAGLLPVFLGNMKHVKNWIIAFVYSSFLTFFFYVFFIRIMHFNFPSF